MRTIDEIIVHCSDTPPNWMAGMSAEKKRDEIRRWHVQERKWKDIGYAAIIDRDGTVAWGRDLNKDGNYFDDIGAHTSGKNSRSIGICLIGGRGSTADDQFEDHFTQEQEKALRAMIEEIRTEFPSIKKVSGHNQYANKACPGFRVPAWYAKKDTKPRTSAAQSTTVQASALQVASGLGGGVAAVGALDGYAQLAAIALFGIIVLAALWIMRERIRLWAMGVK